MDVFDFFSGCGGTSLGFQNYGFNILGGLDFDRDSALTFQRNFPEAAFISDDIRNVAASDLNGILQKRRKTPLLFCGCAPCQPFTKQRRIERKNDIRKTLLPEFLRFIAYWKPEYVFLENVPGLQNVDKTDGLFKSFTDGLTELNYNFDTSIVKASSLGVPQKRQRFILTGAYGKRRLNTIESIVQKYAGGSVTVRDSIEDLPPIFAGESHPSIANHTAARLSDQNLQRIKLTPEGGDRRDWPEQLRIECHEEYTGHTDVYGRMKWDAPASTLTTRCTSYSNGRFGHPSQDRAISVREAARLQTFPDNFVFVGALQSCARQVGNAVPPLMAERISESFVL